MQQPCLANTNRVEPESKISMLRYILVAVINMFNALFCDLDETEDVSVFYCMFYCLLCDL